MEPHRKETKLPKYKSAESGADVLKINFTLYKITSCFM